MIGTLVDGGSTTDAGSAMADGDSAGAVLVATDFVVVVVKVEAAEPKMSAAANRQNTRTSSRFMPDYSHSGLAKSTRYQEGKHVSSKRHIPLSCLGPKAIEQLRREGHNVDALLNRERSGKRGPVQSFADPGLPRAHKYGVSAKEQRTFNGIVFASKFEMNAYRILTERNIQFEHQVDYILQEGFRDENKKWIRPIKYVADFVVRCQDGEHILDTKGMRTANFEMKLKMLKARGKTLFCIRSLGELLDFLIKHGGLERANPAVASTHASVQRGETPQT